VLLIRPLWSGLKYALWQLFTFRSWITFSNHLKYLTRLGFTGLLNIMNLIMHSSSANVLARALPNTGILGWHGDGDTVVMGTVIMGVGILLSWELLSWEWGYCCHGNCYHGSGDTVVMGTVIMGVGILY